MQYSLNGADWKLRGWWPFEWKVYVQKPESPVFQGVTPDLDATVPGCVQADLLQHGLIEDPYYGLNSLDAEWVSQRHWMYEKEFEAPTEWADKRLRLHFEGLDYAAEVYVNGARVIEHEGTFLPAAVDVTEFVRIGEPNQLQVFLWGMGADISQIGFSSTIRQLRPRFCHKWDFSTRLVALGIWDDVYLEITDSAFINNVSMRTKASKQRAKLEISTELKGVDREGYVMLARLIHEHEPVTEQSQRVPGSFGESVLINMEILVDQPELWWPNGYGEQPLYTLILQLLNPDGEVSHEEQRQIGIRTLTFSQTEGSPRDALPYFVLVNGEAIYLKGVNWVPCDHFYGQPNEWRYHWLLRLARDANVNLIRVWGGGLIEKRLFYELCDQAGIMVWQDFPQSSSMLDNTPPVDAAFLSDLAEVAESAIKRRRSHVCTTFWCGGNELFDATGPLNEDHPNLARLGAVSRELDDDRLFLPTTPSGPSFGIDVEKVGEGQHHDVHGPWEYAGEQHYALFNVNDCLLQSEVGAPGAAAPSALARMMPEQAVWPPTRSNPYWRHHGGWWLNHEKLVEWFGPIKDIDDYCRASRFVQMEAVRYAIESNRRRKFRNCGTIIWTLNEPWPTCSNLSLIDYEGNAKPAYDLVRNAFAPRMVSLHYNGLRHVPGEPFGGSIFVNNSRGSVSDCTLSWQARTITGELIDGDATELDLPYDAVAPPFEMLFDVPENLPGQVFLIELFVHKEDRALARNVYIFTTTTEDEHLRPLLELPKCELEVVSLERTSEGSVTAEVRNTGDAVALWVRWGPGPKALALNCRQNGSVLWPGESRTFRVILGQRSEEPTLLLKAFNSDEIPVQCPAP